MALAPCWFLLSFFLSLAGYVVNHLVFIAQIVSKLENEDRYRSGRRSQVRSNIFLRMIRAQERYHIDSAMAILLAERSHLCLWGAKVSNNADTLTDRLYAQKKPKNSHESNDRQVSNGRRLRSGWRMIRLHSWSNKLLEDAVA